MLSSRLFDPGKVECTVVQSTLAVKRLDTHMINLRFVLTFISFKVWTHCDFNEFYFNLMTKGTKTAYDGHEIMWQRLNVQNKFHI